MKGLNRHCQCGCSSIAPEQGEAIEERSDFMKSRIHVTLLGELTKRLKLQIRKGKTGV